MKPFEDEKSLAEYRSQLMQYLNEYGLDAAAILSLARRTEGVVYEPGEAVLRQGEYDHYVYFLVEGSIIISITTHDRTEILGERKPVILLGEISFFNGSPATALVEVGGKSQGVLLRISYEEFRNVLDANPNIQPTLARIGEMRMISQKDGYASYNFFMEMIGGKQDRLVLNRSLLPHLEYLIHQVLLPRLKPEGKILEVGDGPGIICDTIKLVEMARMDELYIQAKHLEDAILNPMQAYPSDLLRGKYIRDRFQAMVTLNMFEQLPPGEVEENLKLASEIVEVGGHLLVIHLKLVDIPMSQTRHDSHLIFKELEDLVNQLYPGILDGQPLVQVSFQDADIDAMMEWNQRFCQAVAKGGLKAPDQPALGVHDTLMKILMDQARRRIFNPDEIQFNWLLWHVTRFPFDLEVQGQNAELGFFYQLFRRRAGEAQPQD